MSKVEISAQSRDTFGKGSARQLRREGRIPAVIYGGEDPVRHISINGHDLDQALKVAQVVLEVDVDGDKINAAPRQVQRDPVKRTLEHVDLLVLSAKEVRERLVVGAAVNKATTRADEEGLEHVQVITVLHEYLDEGLEPDEAIEKAIETVHEQVKEAEAAAAAAAAAEAAKEAAAAEEGGDAGEASDAPAEDSGDDAPAEEGGE
ncbi:MAG: 50S ribosomal protein L25 [Candidatus Nanopelagicales bacterium]